MRNARARALLVSLWVALASLAGPVAAQAWPAKPVRIVVPFAAGGSVDILARILANSLTESTGQTVVVDNRPGAGGNVGGAFVAQSTPDGHTLLMSAPGPYVINQYLYSAMPFTPEDLAPVTVVAQVPNLLIVNSKLPYTSVRQLIDHAKAHPGTLNGSSAGNGSTPHLSLELFKTMAGVNILHVPYNGSSPSRLELLAGRIDLTIDNIAAFMAEIKQGSVRVLATATQKRTRFLPDVPTLSESGLPGYSSAAWYALAAPPGTPKLLVDAINAEVLKVLRNAEVVRRFEAQGAEVVAGSPADTSRFLKQEAATWKKVVEVSGAKAN